MATLRDDFNRANENPLAGGSNWASKIESHDTGGLQLASNVVARTTVGGSAWSCSRWDAATFGPDVRATARIASVSSSDSFGIFARVTNPGLATMNSYEADFSFQFAALTIYKWVNGAATQLATVVIGTYSVNDVIGIEAVGTTIRALRNGSAVLTATDGAVTGAGKVGIAINNAAGGTLDDFSVDTLLKSLPVDGGRRVDRNTLLRL